MEMKKIGVVGCGIMGAGIAQVAAQGGYSVTVSDVSNEAINKGLSVINRWIQRSVEKGKLTDEIGQSIINNIKSTTDLSTFKDCDLIIESVFDNLEVKRKVFAELDNICSKHTIMASNASSLSIIDIATVTKRMDKVLGMHFFNPVPAMKLVEIIKTLATSDETVAIAREFSTKIGKTVVVAPDTPGFIHNRLTAVLSIAAIKMLEDKVASRDDIDNALKYGSNFPMGRLELLDLVGLDTLLQGYENLYQAYKDPRYAPPLLLKQMVAAGWLGRKSGRGFYIYDKDGNKIG